ncbi:HlyD family type I secretion periplasmic adaptor subunit [Sphingobium boeckii]|uniref:Membrane fusion protein (MFP) family protein n=1 Tax=Sphingobium boeckii TaxID=1082345 RepID=A0A7W9AGX4_9SPHN|nr:HlyD family type I secretion periplasmic adaptor subunit [Sphingobium boeckii]MBB5685462.1 HlyD family secretion protein [Sphingobium boeckii]
MSQLLLTQEVQPYDAADLLDDGPVPGIARPLRIAGYALLAFILVFVIWGLIAPLSKAAIASGVVQVEGRRRTVQHLEGGIVQEILVSENDKVRKGQPLVRLDTIQSGAAAVSSRSEYLTLLAEERRLQSELSGSAFVEFPEELRKEAGGRATEIISSQRAILESRRMALGSQMQILRETSSQAQSSIGGLQAQIAAQQSQLALLRGEVETVRQLVDEQLERRSRLLELQRNVNAVEGQIGSLTAQVLTARRAMSEANARMGALGSERRDEVTQKLRDVQLQLTAVREKMKATTDVADRRTISSPADGQVVGLRFTTIGGVVAPGQPILDVVPNRQQFIIVARVRPIDIENVTTGLTTEVRLLPYSGRTVPMLQGKVIAVSGDAITPENGDPPYYAIEVEIDDPALLKKLDVTLLSGMPAEVYVVLGKRSLFSYLFQPLVDSFRRSFREF